MRKSKSAVVVFGVILPGAIGWAALATFVIAPKFSIGVALLFTGLGGLLIGGAVALLLIRWVWRIK